MRRPDPAEILVGGTALILGVGDVVLYRQRQRLVTDVLRRPPVLAGLLVLTAHALDVLGPLDPFRAVARMIPQEIAR